MFAACGFGVWGWFARKGFPHGGRGIVYTDARDSADGPARLSAFIEPQADGRLRFRQERSVKGGPWVQTVDFYYVRRK